MPCVCVCICVCVCVCVCVCGKWQLPALAEFYDESRCCLVMERGNKCLSIIRVFELHAQSDG